MKDLLRRAVEALEAISKAVEPNPNVTALKFENERLHQKLGLVGTELEKERNERKSIQAIHDALKVSHRCRDCSCEGGEIRMDGEDMMPIEEG